MTTLRLSSTALGVTVRSGQRARVVLTDLPYGQVWIWAPPSIRQVKDRLVLEGSRPRVGGEPGDRAVVYRRSLAVADAAAAHGSLYAVPFDPTENDVGGACRESGLTFALTLFPGGDETGGVLLSAHQQYDDVFSSDGTWRTSLANLVATEIHLSDEVLVTPASVETLGIRTDLQIDDVPKAHAGDPLGLPFVADDLTGPGAAVAERERRAWRAGVLPKSTAGVPAETAAALEAAETWVYVVSRDRSLADGPEALPYGCELMGVWKVGRDGTYHYHVYADADAEDLGALPQPVGEGGSPFVLSPVDRVEDAWSSLYAHSSPFPLPQAWAFAALGRLARDREPGFTPLGFWPNPLTASDAGGRDFVTLTPYARWASDERVWQWTLPDPLRVTARLAVEARRATARLEAWSQAAGPALQNAGLVATACFDPDHDRTYLKDVLAPAGAFDMEEAWEGGERGGAAEPTTGTELDHFRYGVGRQRAFLERRARVAGARLEASLASGYAHDLASDLVAAAEAEPDSEPVEDLCASLFDGIAAMCEAGAGGALFAQALSDPDVGVLDALRAAETDAALGDALAALDPPEEPSPVAALRGPVFKLWWSLGRKSLKLGTKFLPSLVAGVLPTRDLLRTEVLGISRGRAGAVVSALFGDALLAAERGGAGPEVSERMWSPAGRPMARRTWHVGDDSYRAGPLRISRRNVVGRQTVVHATDWELWEFEYDRVVSIDVDAVRGGLEAAGKWLDGASGSANAVFLAVALVDRARTGDLRRGDALDVAKLANELVKLYELTERPMGSLGRVLLKAGPALEVASAAATFYAAQQAVDREGLQRLADPDEMKMVGAACGVMGGVLAGAALVTGAPVVGALTVLAAGYSIVGALYVWRADVKATKEREKTDRLRTWLWNWSVWGPRQATPDDLLALAKPGWDGAPAPVEKEALSGAGGQTAAFVREAFTFPSGVLDSSSPYGRGPVTLVVVPEFVPAVGTLLVSATVTNTVTGQTADVKCALHYTSKGDSFCYTAVPEGTTLPADADARDLAHEWAQSVPVPVPEGARPIGTARAPGTRAGLVVGLRAGGGAAGYGADPLRPVRPFVTGAGVVAPAPPALDSLPQGPTPAALWAAATVPIDDPDGALGGGAVAVAGSVYFRAARAFDPAPTFPKTDASGRPKEVGVARERFGDVAESPGAARPAP